MKRGLLIAGALAIVGLLVWAGLPRQHEQRAPAGVQAPLTTAPPLQNAVPVLPTLNPVLSRVSSAVVNISADGKAPVQNMPFLQDPMFRQFFGDPEQMPQRSTRSAGSGVIIDATNGYVLTNHHVIANADRIHVTLTDRRELQAKVVGSDPETDIAVLKIDARDLTAMPIAEAESLKIGDFVIALGNPFGLGQTATLGIVSALGRSGLGIEGYEDFIQTDASINPGNSGGALIDQTGNLVGINTAILSGSGGNVGIGFAVPANMAMRSASQIIQYGKVQRGEIGVSIQDLTPELADAMGVESNTGALVSEVMPSTAAERAGLRAGDIITGLDGKPIASGTSLRNRVGMMRPGDRIKLEVYRDRRNLAVELELGERRADSRSPARGGDQGNDDLGDRFAGLRLGPVPQGAPHAPDGRGVYVEAVQPGSTAADAGIQPGDVIIGADREDVSGPADLQRIASRAAGRPLLLHIQRGSASLFVALR